MSADGAKRTGCATAVRADPARHILNIDSERHRTMRTVDFNMRRTRFMNIYVPPKGGPDDYKPKLQPTPCCAATSTGT